MHRLSDHILSLFFFYPYWYISVEKIQVETENSNLAKTHIIVIWILMIILVYKV